MNIILYHKNGSFQRFFNQSDNDIRRFKLNVSFDNLTKVEILDGYHVKETLQQPLTETERNEIQLETLATELKQQMDAQAQIELEKRVLCLHLSRVGLMLPSTKHFVGKLLVCQNEKQEGFAFILKDEAEKCQVIFFPTDLIRVEEVTKGHIIYLKQLREIANEPLS